MVRAFGRRPGAHTLILVLNHRCNLRCTYCPSRRGGARLDEKTARTAVELYLKRAAGTAGRVKIAGGEPLLDFLLLKKIVGWTQARTRPDGPEVTCEVTTNGVLLDRARLDFFSRCRNVELIVSLDGARKTQLAHRRSPCFSPNAFDGIYAHRRRLARMPRLSVNMVVAPAQAGRLLENFLFIVRLGFRRMNILPAYYVRWRRKELEALGRQLFLLASLLKNTALGRRVFIKNAFVRAPDILFNTGTVVDCNGDIYATNAVLIRPLARLKPRLCRGRIQACRRFPEPRLSSTERRLIDDSLDSQVLDSTRRADALLSAFVHRLVS